MVQLLNKLHIPRMSDIILSGVMRSIRRLNNRRGMNYFEGDKKVENFIEQNDLDMSDPDDVAKAVRKYNELRS